jgi:hypothetical protein
MALLRDQPADSQKLKHCGSSQGNGIGKSKRNTGCLLLLLLGPSSNAALLGEHRRLAGATLATTLAAAASAPLSLGLDKGCGVVVPLVFHDLLDLHTKERSCVGCLL